MQCVTSGNPVNGSEPSPAPAPLSSPAQNEMPLYRVCKKQCAQSSATLAHSVQLTAAAHALCSSEHTQRPETQPPRRPHPRGPVTRKTAFLHGTDVYVSRPDGTLRYSLEPGCACEPVETVPSCVLTASLDEHFVPVLCDLCFGHTKEEYEAVRSGLSLDQSTGYGVGMAGVFAENSKPGANYPPPVGDGDINPSAMGRYQLLRADAPYIVHPKPARLLWEHKGKALGEVLSYWHVHRKDACGVNALVQVGNDERGTDFWNIGRSHVSGFSWCTVDRGKRDVVVELSAVLVPARKGCYATFVPGPRLNEVLNIMHYGPNRDRNPTTYVNAMLTASAGEDDNPLVRLIMEQQRSPSPSHVPDSAEEGTFERELIDTIRKQLKTARLLRKHRDDSALGCHNRVGRQEFETINGARAHEEILSTAAMISATATNAAAAAPTSGGAPQTYYCPAPIPPSSTSLEDMRRELSNMVAAALETERVSERKRKADDELRENILEMGKRVRTIEQTNETLAKLLTATAHSGEIKNIALSRFPTYEAGTGSAETCDAMQAIHTGSAQTLNELASMNRFYAAPPTRGNVVGNAVVGSSSQDVIAGFLRELTTIMRSVNDKNGTGVLPAGAPTAAIPAPLPPPRSTDSAPPEHHPIISKESKEALMALYPE
ncbi:ORF63 [Ranid herpesvirus 1]|uniref:ORF63 n=1 Tax=Ranid herpesvirus 1 TaxID=85655 RepID=Q14VP5_9VIRU|nr:ORF63 [Ranid herpesvirus 1]ABG25721.1 ORF63 [Ranid herpesvirus 1]